MVIDKTQHAVAATWARVLARLGGIHLLEVTTTPERLDGKGLGDVFEVLVEGPGVTWLAKHGHLARARACDRLAAAKDLRAIHTKRGDYDDMERRLAVLAQDLAGEVEHRLRLLAEAARAWPRYRRHEVDHR